MVREELSSIAELSSGAPKLQKLVQFLQEQEGVAVAFSGGVDSTFLLRVAGEVLPGRVLALTAVSPVLMEKERLRAQALAQSLGIRHLLVPTREMEDPLYRQNTPQRCYYCKHLLMTQLREVAKREGFPLLVEGSNADDVHDWRPGRRALEELGIPSPLLLAGLTKAEIREYSRRLGLPTWNAPSRPCLASRIPFGLPITEEALRRVAAMEEALEAMGFTVYRARAHGELLRLEVLPEQLPLVEARRDEVVAAARKAGFRWVTLDLEGYRPSRP